MPAKRHLKRSLDTQEVLTSRVSKRAKSLLDAKAKASAVSVSIYVRQVLYRHLGLIKENADA